MGEFIRVCDIYKQYGEEENTTNAVNGVSFEIENGEFVGIMGASGSGKTTILNMVSAIDRVSQGHIYYKNIDITKMRDE